MSEKMDGVRGYWNGKKLISRQGRYIKCPKKFIDDLTSLSLRFEITFDGELWMGRGTTYLNVTTVLNSNNSDWSGIEYYIFDIPSHAETAFEERMELMNRIKTQLPPYIHIVENICCNGKDHLNNYFNSILANNGEGVILRQPNKETAMGYSNSILKVKVCHQLCFVSNSFSAIWRHRSTSVGYRRGRTFMSTVTEIIGVVW